MDGRLKQYGFEWGPVDVSRACNDEEKGWVVLMLKTKKHPNGIQVYVTKTGKVRVHSDKGEWLPKEPASLIGDEHGPDDNSFNVVDIDA